MRHRLYYIVLMLSVDVYTSTECVCTMHVNAPRSGKTHNSIWEDKRVSFTPSQLTCYYDTKKINLHFVYNGLTLEQRYLHSYKNIFIYILFEFLIAKKDTLLKLNAQFTGSNKHPQWGSAQMVFLCISFEFSHVLCVCYNMSSEYGIMHGIWLFLIL